MPQTQNDSVDRLIRFELGTESYNRGFLRPTLRGSMFYARGKVDGVFKMVSTRKTDFDEALRVCLEKTRLLQDGQSISDDERPPETFIELAKKYLDTCSDGEKAIVAALLRFVPRQIRPNEVNQLTADNICVKRWVNGCLAATRKRMIYSPLNTINNFGFRRGWCNRRYVVPPRVGHRPISFLQPYEFEALHSRAPGDLADMLMFLACVGCRPGELMKFEYSHWEYGWVKLVDRKSPTDDERSCLVQAFPTAEALLTRRTRVNRPTPGLRAFPSIAGEPLPTSTMAAERKVNLALRTLAEDAGVHKKVTLKIFRATWATWYQTVFKDIRQLQSAGGWANLSVVEKHYAGKASPSIVPDVCRIWGIDPNNLNPWREPVGRYLPPDPWLGARGTRH